MKSFLFAALLGAAAGLVFINPAIRQALLKGPARAIDFYDAAYPSDPAKRQALDACSRQEPNFDRLDAAARESCYWQFLPSVAAKTGGHGIVSGAAPAANVVDLLQAAGRGHMPENDIRAQEQTLRARPAAAPQRAAPTPALPVAAGKGR